MMQGYTNRLLLTCRGEQEEGEMAVASVRRMSRNTGRATIVVAAAAALTCMSSGATGSGNRCQANANHLRMALIDTGKQLASSCHMRNVECFHPSSRTTITLLPRHLTLIAGSEKWPRSANMASTPVKHSITPPSMRQASLP